MTPNLGAQTGHVGTGDTVICGGRYAPVVRVTAHPPTDTAHGGPIRPDLTAVEVITSNGSRWLGADRAWIGSDLRMHWERS